MFRKKTDNFAERSLLWKISHPKQATVSYLFGSHHALDEKNRDKVLNAIFDLKIIDSVDLVISETGVLDKAFGKNFEYEFPTLKRNRLTERSKNQMDTRLVDYATKNKVPTLRLENAEDGLNGLIKAAADQADHNYSKPKNIIKGLAIGFTFPIGLPIFSIQRTVKNSIQHNKMKKNYLEQNTDFEFFKTPARKHMIDNRNLSWIHYGVSIDEEHPLSSIDPNVKDLLLCENDDIKPDTFSLKKLLPKLNLFIIVGVGHLKANGKGLVELLRDEGYQVEAVKDWMNNEATEGKKLNFRNDR